MFSCPVLSSAGNTWVSARQDGKVFLYLGEGVCRQLDFACLKAQFLFNSMTTFSNMLKIFPCFEYACACQYILFDFGAVCSFDFLPQKACTH